MLTSNILNRIFFIKGSQYGTAFTVEVDDREYLVSAKHLFEFPDKINCIKLMHDNKWIDLSVQFVGIGNGEVDIVVFSPSIALTPKEFVAPCGSAGAVLGQDVYFAGYPFKLWANLGPAMSNRPAPFIRKGIISSAFDISDPTRRIFIDAINNEGFSGGPVVFSLIGNATNQFHVLGVVSGFRTDHEMVLGPDGNPNGMTVEYNTGFLLAFGIEHALDLINLNPIGLPVHS